jgi:hypothetical protein
MSNIDPEILARAKRDYGENCELERLTEWSYTYKCGPKSFCRISRFMAEQGFEVSASEIRSRWPAMNHHERIDFACNFQVKNAWTTNDDDILDVIMNDGDDDIWSGCALTMLRHTNRNKVVEFLIQRVRLSESEKPPVNYIQALGMAADRRATEVIRPYYDRLSRAMEKETDIGVPDDIFWGPIPYFPYLCVAGDLFRIEGAKEYEQAIQKYFDHPKEQVRWWAEHALGIEGPTTQKRNAEYARTGRFS